MWFILKSFLCHDSVFSFLCVCCSRRCTNKRFEGFVPAEWSRMTSPLSRPLTFELAAMRSLPAMRSLAAGLSGLKLLSVRACWVQTEQTSVFSGSFFSFSAGRVEVSLQDVNHYLGVNVCLCVKLHTDALQWLMWTVRLSKCTLDWDYREIFH